MKIYSTARKAGKSKQVITIKIKYHLMLINIQITRPSINCNKIQHYSIIYLILL